MVRYARAANVARLVAKVNPLLWNLLDPKQLDLDFATVSLVLSRPSLFCDEFRLARWLFAWARHNKPDDEQASTLTSLIKWEMLAEAEVEWLLQRPEVDFMGSSRLSKEVALIRKNLCTVQTPFNDAPEGLQKPSFLRSQGSVCYFPRRPATRSRASRCGEGAAPW